MGTARWVIGAMIALGSVEATAGGHCTGDGPCGPVGLEWAVPQGFAGADFRPACAAHDRCYSMPGVSRAYCDRQFHRRLRCACRSSRCPILCRVTADTMFVVTRVFGGPAFRGSQRGWYTERGLRVVPRR